MAQYSVYRPRAATPWASLEQLQREMNSLFDRRSGGWAGRASGRGVFPPVNLYETEDAYVLTAELPGVDPDAIQVSIDGTTVSIQGERRTELDARSDGQQGQQDRQEANVHRRERQSGRFRRAFSLPNGVEPDKVEAVHRTGILMLRIPKSPEAQPRQIAVQAS